MRVTTVVRAVRDWFLLAAGLLRAACIGSYKFKISSRNDTAVIMGNGPSLKKDLEKIYPLLGVADIYCVNFFALNDIFWKIRPGYYVIADPVFWRADISESFKEDNERLLSSLLRVDWPFTLIFPSAGASYFKSRLSRNSNIIFCPVPPNGIIFRNERIALQSYSLGASTPVFINVLILALWASLKSGVKKVRIFGADFSSFKEYFVDQKTNELHSDFSHFYNNTQAQSNADEKYPASKKKMIHQRLYQNWLSFYQMYLLSEFSRRKNVQVINDSSNSFLDCFSREG